MRPLTRVNKLFALIIVLIVIALSFLIFIYKLSRSSIIDNYQQFTTSILTDSVQVFRNQYGIPHIIAKNEKDLFFMIGYCQAQDRLWQMDYLRRIGSGRLSEIFGEDYVESDKFLRIFSMKKVSIENYKLLSKKMKILLDAYSNGVNHYIKNNSKKFSIEFGSLNYSPELWEPSDCLLIARVFSFYQNHGFWADLTMGEILEQIGTFHAADLLYNYPSVSPCIMDNDTVNFAKALSPISSTITQSDTNRNQNGLLSDLNSNLKSVKNKLHIQTYSVGSNSWAMKKSKETSSSAIIANDPHLWLSLPSLWYQMHISCPSINAIGNAIIGIPSLLIGRNNYIGWGISSAMIDDCDFFIEKITTNSNDYYYSESGNKKKFKFISDTIKIKNHEPVIHYCRYTDKSIVISDFYTFQKKNNVKTNKKSNFYKNYCITFSWTGKFHSNEIEPIYQLNKAKNWNDFNKALNKWGSPALNFTYADKVGNIGILSAGYVPIRSDSVNYSFPNPSWISKNHWNGFYNLANNFSQYNPAKKFVAAANNKIIRANNYNLGIYWDLPSRAERIQELLMAINDYSVQDAKIIQQDYNSNYAKDILYIILPLLQKNYRSMSKIEQKSLELLIKWDTYMSPQLSSPTIFNLFMDKFVYNTFQDELGDRLFNEYNSIPNLTYCKILELVYKNESQWFDNKKTKQTETKENIIIESFKEAIAEIQTIYKTDNVYSWKWGVIHTITLNHEFSNNSFMKPLVTNGPYERGGNSTTINYTEWRINNYSDILVAASSRFISDIGDSVVYSVIPGGVSGDPISENYSNQVQLWLNGGYIKLSMKNIPNDDFELRILALPE